MMRSSIHRTISRATSVMLGLLVVSTLPAFFPRAAIAQTFSNTANITINDAGVGDIPSAATPYPSPITVTGLSGTVTTVTVTLHGLSHGFPEDVDILLVGPAGQTVLLMSDAGAGFPVDNLTLSFADSAPSPLPDFDPITSGTFRPRNVDNGTADAFPVPAPPGPYQSGTQFQTLAVFNGTDPNGVWSLFVIDEFEGDSGQIAGGWSLTLVIASPPPPPDTSGSFFTLTPCRVADTRGPAGPSGGPALAANTTRTFPAAGVCGIPGDAVAIAINVTVVEETNVGDLRLYAAGGAVPSASTINFTANHVRANNAIIPLGAGGAIAVQTDMPAGTTQFLFDVTGYFK